MSNNETSIPSALERLDKGIKLLHGATSGLELILRRAEELLRDSDLPLAVIADRAGFMHSEYFSVVFKRWMGVSPSNYRQSQHPA